jgi:hypothetical protein
LTKKDAVYVSTKSPRYEDKSDPIKFTLLPTSMGKNISVVSCGNTMGTAVPYFMCINFRIYMYFGRKILAGHIISTVQVIWPKAYISENISYLAPMIKDRGHNTFLM